MCTDSSVYVAVDKTLVSKKLSSLDSIIALMFLKL